MNKFKVGDKVKVVRAYFTSGRLMPKEDYNSAIEKIMGTIQTIKSISEGHSFPYILEGDNTNSWKDEELEAVGKRAKESFPKFLLSKGERENPIELNTEAEVKKEIKKIASDSESYDNCFKVYTIKAVKTVVLEDTVIIKGLN